MPLKRRAAPRAEIMVWDGSAWQKALAESATYPHLRVGICKEGDEAHVLTLGSDSRSPFDWGLVTDSRMLMFNESVWERRRGNTEKTVLPSAARTASGNSADQTNYNARGVALYIYISAVSGSFAAGEGLRLRVQFKDPVSGRYTALAPWTSYFTTPTDQAYIIYPGVTDIGGVVATKNDVPLPRSWRVQYEITGTNPSFTFSVGACYVV